MIYVVTVCVRTKGASSARVPSAKQLQGSQVGSALVAGYSLCAHGAQAGRSLKLRLCHVLPHTPETWYKMLGTPAKVCRIPAELLQRTLGVSASMV